MTTLDIDNLPAGRELDALISERVMGLKTLPHPFVDGELALWSMDDDGYEELPHYSTDIATAFTLLVKFGLTLAPYGEGESIKQWHAADGRVLSFADTAPLAICRAALKAIKA